MIKINHLFILTLVTFITLFISPSSVAEPSKTVTVLLNWFPEADDGGIYDALAFNLYKKVGLDVKVIPGGEKPHGQMQLAAGKYDFYTGGAMGVLHAIKAGLPVEAVASMLQKPLTAIITHKDISNLEELKGHTILVSESGRFSYWPWLMQKYNYEENQRRPYLGSVAPFLMNSSIAQQGYVTYEPYIIRKQGDHCNVFPLAEYGLPGPGEILEVNTNFANQHPKIVERFISATIAGYKQYLVDPIKANLLIHQAYPTVSLGTLQYGYNILKNGCYITGNGCHLKNIGHLSLAEWKAVYLFMLKWHLLTPFSGSSSD